MAAAFTERPTAIPFEDGVPERAVSRADLQRLTDHGALAAWYRTSWSRSQDNLRFLAPPVLPAASVDVSNEWSNQPRVVKMFRTASLAVRGFLAIGLMIGFYGLAALVVGGLLYVPYAEIVYLNRLDFRIALFCVVGAAVVFLSVMPRPDRFQPPGPELHASEHPELFELLESVQGATRQRGPRNVYLILDVNAWVAQRGGLMGIGSRRVMGLGLPLMQALTVEQLRAVIAHEFGHYYGGDTMLGSWIQKTRMGIVRTIESLGDSWIRMPFIAYATLFFRVTNAVSRQQEFAADALAARVVSAQALADGLKQLHRAAAAFGAFWQLEYVAALRYQVRPPLAAGFARFLHHRHVADQAENVLQAALTTVTPAPYDSHPPLPERFAALAQFKSPDGGGDTREAVALLGNLPECERALISIAVDPQVKTLRSVEWSEIPALVWYPSWRAEVTRQAKALADATVADAPRLCREPHAIARRVVTPTGYLLDMEQRIAQTRHVIAIAIAVALVDAGWTMKGELGDPVTCTRGTDLCEPFEATAKFISGELTTEAWRSYCDRLNISTLPLVPATIRGHGA